MERERGTSAKAQPTLVQRALSYAARGYYVFPLASGSKGEHLPGGWPSSTRDPAGVRALWARYPQANIGIACKPSGIAVLDPDAPHGVADAMTGEVGLSANGRAAWAALARQHGWPAQGDVTTPRGGLHVYFRDPHGLGSSSGALPPGIDVKASGGERGGYVLAPGSVVDGRTYEGRLPAVTDLPEVPPSLLAMLQASNWDLTDLGDGDGSGTTHEHYDAWSAFATVDGAP